MKVKDIKIGMKVVPHRKSMLNGLDESVVWERAKFLKQPYLYVRAKFFTSMGKPYFLLSHTRNAKTLLGHPDGDYFLASDFKKFS